jgi:hypothetical protein
MFLPGGGEFPRHLRLVTTEHRLAKECREQVQRKNRFARILSKTFYGRKWYVVYENYHKGKITGMTSAPRSERSRTQEREIKEEIKRHNELALKRMRDNNPNPGTYKHLLETLPSSISGRIVKHRKLENRTWELILDDGTRIIRLFNTNIIVWKPNGDLVLDTGGWNTITTYDRINRYSPVHIWSVKNSLYVGISGEHWIGDLKPRERQKLWTKYYDGITFRKTAAGKWREVGDDGKIIGWNKTKK